MTIDIQALIDQRPHLKDPLELYAKWQQFSREVAKLLPNNEGALSAEEASTYPRKKAGDIFRLFVSIFNLPAVEFEPVRQALEEGNIDFLRLPIDEVPTIPALHVSQDELASILFLLGRPHFLALGEAFRLIGQPWEDGRCPLCSARPTLTSVIEGPKRNLHCSFCGTSGPYRFIGCPNCGTVDATKLNTIVSEDEPGFRVVTCDECHTYVKVMETSVLQEMTLDLADMASLPLDIVTQEKGYSRLAPNPISLKKMG